MAGGGAGGGAGDALLYISTSRPSRARRGIARPLCAVRVWLGSLREYMAHFRYKLRNYYVRMSKNVALYPHDRF